VDETADYGVSPTNTLHLHDFDAPTLKASGSMSTASAEGTDAACEAALRVRY
jgi:hypothetical protein